MQELKRVECRGCVNTCHVMAEVSGSCSSCVIQWGTVLLVDFFLLKLTTWFGTFNSSPLFFNGSYSVGPRIANISHGARMLTWMQR